MHLSFRYLSQLLLIICNSFITTAEGVQREAKPVKLGLRILDIRKVDDRSESIRGEFVIFINWTDTSLAVPGQTTEMVVPEAEIDMPMIMVRGVDQVEALGQPIVRVTPAGEATYIHRYLGDIHQAFNFKPFPFDTQLWTITLFSTELDKYWIEFDDTYLGQIRADSLSTTNWEVNYIDFQVSEISNFGNPVQLINLNFTLKRNPIFYIWKIMIPIILVVFMSWSVFWINPTNISAQLTVSVTAILTLVAFQFSVSQLMPPLSYLTKMDFFTIGADLFVFFAFVETIITSYYEDRGRSKISEKIDYYARFLFPIAFLILMAFTLI